MTLHVRAITALLLGLGLAGMGSLRQSYASGITISDCPATESALSSDITSVGAGGTVRFACTSPTVIHFDTASGGTGSRITIAQSVSLDASNSPQPVTLDGAKSAQLFAVNAGVNFTVNGLTLSNGLASSPSSSDLALNEGGAVFVSAGAVLNLANSTLAGNNAAWMGGAIANEGGTLHVAHSAFSGNVDGGGAGAAIFYQDASNPLGTVTVTDSTFSNNPTMPINGQGSQSSLTVTNSTFSNNNDTAIGVEGTANISHSTFSGNSVTSIININNTMTIADSTFVNDAGSAIFNVGGTLSVTGSTFTNNTASDAGGAIGNEATANIANSTFSGNSGGRGGAIFNYENARMGIVNSTFFNNSARQAGGTIFNEGTLTVGASIVANNASAGNCFNQTGLDPSGVPYSSVVTDNGYNLESGTDCGFTSSGSHQNTDPVLGPLSDNGGPTQTMAPAVTSPAIDAVPISSTLCPSTDQRGISRPDNGEPFCDIGAYEHQDTTTTSLTSSVNPSVYGQSVTFTATVVPQGGTTTPTGIVTFGDGVTTLGTAPLDGSGKARYTTGVLRVGNHPITASYGGSAEFIGSSSNVLTQQIGYGVKVLSAPRLTVALQLQGSNGANVSAATVPVIAECVVGYTSTPPTNCGSSPKQTINAPFVFVNNFRGQGAAYSYSVSSRGLAKAQTYYLLVQAGADPNWHPIQFTY